MPFIREPASLGVGPATKLLSLFGRDVLKHVLLSLPGAWSVEGNSVLPINVVLDFLMLKSSSNPL